jgi:hypothetical protein
MTRAWLIFVGRQVAGLTVLGAVAGAVYETARIIVGGAR